MQGHVASHLCRVRAAAWRTRRREGGPRETEQARGQGPKFGALLLLHARTMNRSCPSPPTFIFGCTGAPQKRLRESPRHFNKTRYSRERPASSLDRSFPNPLPKARHCTSRHSSRRAASAPAQAGGSVRSVLRSTADSPFVSARAWPRFLLPSRHLRAPTSPIGNRPTVHRVSPILSVNIDIRLLKTPSVVACLPSRHPLENIHIAHCIATRTGDCNLHRPQPSV